MKKFYVGIKGLVVKDNKILLLKKAEKGFWEAPGGRIDDDESIPQTLNRELVEELPNIKNIKIKDLVGAFRLPQDIEEDISLTLIYYVVTAEFDGDPQISEEHNDWKWATKAEALEMISDKQDIINKILK